MITVAHLKRLREIVRTIRRHGLDGPLTQHLSIPFLAGILNVVGGKAEFDDHQPYGVRLCEALQELGPIFVKFGQIMSTRPDLFPEDVIRELNVLQDQVSPFSGVQARQIIEESLNSPIDTVFSSFDEIPVASASVAQAHNAVLRSSEDVVVKVLRPGIRNQISLDIQVMYSLARLFNLFRPNSENYRPRDLVEYFENVMLNSLDLTVEAANANRFRNRFEDDDFIYVPEVYWKYTRSDVLVLERVEGMSVRDIEDLRETGVDLQLFSENLVRTFFIQAFHDRFFHGDLHPGNLFVSELGQLRVVDFGIMGILSEIDCRYLVENILAILRQDYQRVVDLHIRSGWAPPDIPTQEFEICIRSVCEQYVNQPVGEISSGRLMGRLFRVFREFGIVVQPQLLLFQKTYLNLEGLVKTLCPELDIGATARPILEDWVRKQASISNISEKIRAETPYLLSIAPEIPRLAHTVLSYIHENQMRGRGMSSIQGPGGISPGLFFTLLGSASLIAAVVDWSSDGFGFLTLILGIAAVACLRIAWPKNRK